MPKRFFTVHLTIDHDPSLDRPFAGVYAVMEDLPDQGDQRLLGNSTDFSCSARNNQEIVSYLLEQAADCIEEAYES